MREFALTPTPQCSLRSGMKPRRLQKRKQWLPGRKGISRFTAFRLRSKTISTFGGCRPRRLVQLSAYQPAADATVVAHLKGPALSSSVRPTSISSRPDWLACARRMAHRAIYSTRGSFREDQAPVLRWRLPPVSFRSPSVPIPPAQDECLRASTISSASSPAWDWCRPPEWCTPAARSTAFRYSRSRSMTHPHRSHA